MVTRVWHIIRKEVLVGKRDNLSFLASLLYLVGLIFVIFKIFTDMSVPTRVGIFWIVMVFSCIDVVSGSFDKTSMRRHMSYYMLYDPFEFMTAKFLINGVKLIMIGVCSLVLFILFSGTPLADPLLFSKSFLLTIMGILGTLTLTSIIAMYSEQSGAMIYVLSLPLLIPILLIGMRTSLIAERAIFDSAVNSNLLLLLGIDLIMIVLTFVFINFTWKP